MEEFEQLILSQLPVGPHTLSNNPTDTLLIGADGPGQFLSDDVDSIITTTFNYAVTLNELGQSDLAERFMAKALNLLRFGSQVLKAKQRQIQASYGVILNNKKAQLALQKEEVVLAKQQLVQVQVQVQEDPSVNIENRLPAKLPSSKDVALALKQLL